MYCNRRNNNNNHKAINAAKFKKGIFLHNNTFNKKIKCLFNQNTEKNAFYIKKLFKINRKMYNNKKTNIIHK